MATKNATTQKIIQTKSSGSSTGASANEVLDFSKEELQSLNKELATLNSQLENKVEELETASGLVTNLLRSTEYAAVFLDRGFQIKLFTSPAEQLLSLRPTDVDRPISEITSRITDPDLLDDCRAVLDRHVNIEREVWTEYGTGSQPLIQPNQTSDNKSAPRETPRCFLRRVLPFRTANDRIDGIVITLMDITDRKRAETCEIRLLAEAISDLGEGILITDGDVDWPGAQITFVNESMCRISGYSAEELIGQTPRILQSAATSEATRAQVRRELARNHSCSVELINCRKDGTPYEAELFITPMFDAAGNRTRFVSIHREITERKEAERALQQREERFRQIFEHAATGIAITDWQGCFQQCNPAYCQILGYSQDELCELRFDSLIHPDDRERNLAELRRLQAEQFSFFEIENRYIRKNGQPVWVRKFVSTLRDETGKPAQLVALVTDVDDRRRQEQSLREREERLRAILNTASDAILNIDRSGIITDVNPATEQMFGYTQEELVTQNVKILMPRPYYDEHDGYITRYLETGEPRIIGIRREVVGRHKDGSTFPVELAVSIVDQLGLFTVIIRDISERKALQRDILAIAEGEQHRIGQDLHDGTQQELVGLGMLAQTLVNNLGKETAEGSQAGMSASCQLAKRILDGIARAHQEVQTISRGLVRMRLVNEGLMDALRELASRTDDLEGITCAFKCEHPIEIANSLTATHLYRIAQEAITNALKHARPEHILISLELHNGQPFLQVADDGTGFDLTEQSEGIGLKTMVYRASLIGANLTITPVETGGTLVTCKVFGGGSLL